MDPFDSLPAELRIQVLTELRPRAIASLTRSSPVMHKQYRTSKAFIDRTMMAADIDDEMMQDAMFIILCPDLKECKNDPKSRRKLVRLWETQQLPNPLNPRRNGTIDIVVKLYRRLLMYIEDYLAKSTAPFPSRAYFGLPNLSTSRATFKGRILCDGFDVSCLNGSERTRLIRFFLRYELICKMWATSNIHQRGQITSYWFNPPETHPYLRWEKEALLCVREYVESLYEAIFAQNGDAWMHDTQAAQSSPLPSELMFPNLIWFKVRAYGLDTAFGLGGHYIISLLASFGFDLVTNLVPAATTGQHGGHCVMRWLKTFFIDDDLVWRWALPGVHFENMDVGIDGVELAKSPGLYRKLYPYVWGLCQRSYKRRAWVFFDDDRFFRRGGVLSHFPLDADLVLQRDDKEYWEQNLAPSANYREEKVTDYKYNPIRGPLPRFFDEPLAGELALFWWQDADPEWRPRRQGAWANQFPFLRADNVLY
ncbi:hypothetical protein NM208_g8645 [Fusarium decemcellulare]|uniref:Uncharacterized protein n=1 Tax=Fusarium decemcellulare TaxID=57161 RepID=A0ACC1S4P2_9HYPO|nr:hypothetical protein NM208_g8645 [Fusarium decemcellulare]